MECASVGDLSAAEVAAKIVETCYLGEQNVGIHLLGALAGKVLRVSPPLTITHEEARASLELFHRLLARLGKQLGARSLAGAAV
jgi:4-aminobutyrate aminotransferase-like enzyme